MTDSRNSVEGGRMLVRHFFAWVLVIYASIVGWVYASFSPVDAFTIGLALYPFVTTGWYFSTKDTVHRLRLKEMTRTEKLNIILLLLGLFMSAGLINHTYPNFF